MTDQLLPNLGGAHTYLYAKLFSDTSCSQLAAGLNTVGYIADGVCHHQVSMDPISFRATSDTLLYVRVMMGFVTYLGTVYWKREL